MAGARDADPFGTAELRHAVLATWAATPSRFREDANAEELLSIGYRGRVIAELAANGADAARAAGVPGEVAVGMDSVGRELWVANTGAPLDATGVAALASLRASAKRDSATVGHFGVGFTAVRALTDEPLIVSTTGAVRFSVAETRRAVEGLGSAGLGSAALEKELSRRGDQLPALRLPWPVPVGAALAPPEGYVTSVWLPLRADVDADALAASLTTELATDLLWALPDLVAVSVPGYRVERSAEPDAGAGGEAGVEGAAATERITITPSALCVPAGGIVPLQTHEVGEKRVEDYRVLRRSGAIPAALLADRPVEERRRAAWQLAWIVPLDPDGHPAETGPAAGPSVVGAPTPTAEPVDLPARLVITVPVDESRGRVAAGSLTDFLVGVAGQAYAELVRGAPAEDRLALLPPVSFPRGEFDGALRGAVVAALESTEFLAGAGGLGLRPADAVVVSPLRGAAAECAVEALPGLIPWPARSVDLERLRQLGVRVLPVSSLTEALAQLDRPVVFWRTVYDGLAGVPVDELADLPVPKSGGGTMVGPRGVLLPEQEPEAGSASWAARAARLVPGLRLAAAGADHPLLRRLGAIPADAAAVLADPVVAREIQRRLDDLDAGLAGEPDLQDATDFARLVLDLLRSAGAGALAGAGHGGVPLADVLLTDTDGELWPAGSLLLPDAPLAAVLADDVDLPVVAPTWTAEYGAELLETLGVRSGFGLSRFALPPGPGVDLPDIDRWWAEQSGVAYGHSDGEDEWETAITDLDLVDDAAWPTALAMIASNRDTRDALRHSARGPSYTAWWLARNAAVDGVPPRRWRAPGSVDLAGLYDEFPVDLPADVCADLGVLRGVDDAAGDSGELLRRWADPARTVAPWRVAALTEALIAALVGALENAGADSEARAGVADDLPDSVRTLTGAVVDAEIATVADDPAALQVLDPARLVAGGRDPQRTADVLDLPLASEEYRFEVEGLGSASGPVSLREVPGAARCLDAAGRADLGDRLVRVVPELSVRAVDETTRGALRPDADARLTWWLDGDAVLVDGSAAGVGRAVAHLAGRWTDRHRLVAAANGDPGDLAETALD